MTAENKPVHFLDYAMITLFMLAPFGIMIGLLGAALEQDWIMWSGLVVGGVSAVIIGTLALIVRLSPLDETQLTKRQSDELS